MSVLKPHFWISLGFLLLAATGCQVIATPITPLPTAPLTTEPITPDPITWAWSYQAGDYIRSRPMVNGDIVYIGADDNQMHAVDAKTGEAIWSYETADNVTSAAVIADDQLYFGSWDGAIYALDTTGELGWKYRTDGWVSATPVLHGENLYVGSQDGVFYALAAKSGQLVWRYRTRGRIEAGAAITDKLIVFASTDGYIHALDLENGQRQWDFYTEGAVIAAPVVAGNRVYVASLNRTLHALDATQGDLLWTFTAETAIGATPAVTNSAVFIGTDDGTVLALSTENGRPIWQQATGEMIRSTPTIWNGLLFVGTNSGNLYALDSRSGMILWNYRLGGTIAQGPTINDDRLYVGSTARSVQAFDLGAVHLLQRPSVAESAPIDAQTLDGQETAALYAERSQGMPSISEYNRLWTAKAAMPDIDAVRDLHDVIDYRPQSPAAYQAYVILARTYAEQEAPNATDNYRAALALDDNVTLRLELAHYLETQGDRAGAYAEYHAILNRQPDAFADMRRTGPDPLQTAADLNKALYYTDVLETLRAVDAPAALPLRAQAYMGLGRYAEAATAYRTQIRSNPDDETARMGLGLALAWLGDGEAALDLYSTVDTPESQQRQAQLFAAEEPERALALYEAASNPSSWWAATALLESQARFTETLPLYARLAESDSQFADDAAYRLFVLGQRLDDVEAQAKGQSLLKRFGLNWLALRSTGAELEFESTPAIFSDNVLKDKVEALEAIGRNDLAHLELVFAVRFRRTPETVLAMAQALAQQGDTREAQSIAERFVNQQAFVPPAFWELSYPRPYPDMVHAVAAEFDVDPLLIWAVMREESRYDPDALSQARARGLMQVIPATQDWIAEALGEVQAPGDAYIPDTSIRMSAWLLRFLIDYFDGDIELAVLAYNGGAGSVDSWLADPDVENRDDLLRWIGYSETRLYLKRVALSYEVYRTLYGSK